MPKFLMTELVNSATYITARLGAGAGAANQLVEAKEKGKFVKLGAESRYVLAALGDEIEGVIDSINNGTADGFSIGAVRFGGNLSVTFDGLQGTPGTGVVALMDYVLVGSVVAKDTALPGAPKVVKATTQASAKATPFACRVVSLGTAGTGAVGTEGVIQFVCQG